MKVLVTGANGFVGKQLCEILCANGHEVTGIVRRPISQDYWQASKNLTIICVDNIDRHTIWPECLAGIDLVIHLAARVHVMEDHVADPLASYRETNRYGSELLALEAAKAGVKRFIFMSTAKVNGECTQGTPFREDNVANPEDAYAQSKWEAEEALMRIAKETGMEFVILRPPLIYGPGVGANFQSLLHWVHTKKPLPFGRIKNKRSFIALDNLIAAIQVVMTHPQAANQLFLISDGVDLSMSELISLIDPSARQFGLPAWLLWTVAFLTGQRHKARRLLQSFQLDTNKIQTMLDWQPAMPPKEGIAKLFPKPLYVPSLVP